MSDFIAAAQTGDLSKVRTLLEADRSLLHARDKDKNMTGFHWAALRGHEHVVDYLLCQKADVNAPGYKGRNVLIFASECKTDNTSVIEKVIKAGCNVNERSDHEQKVTALNIACGYGHVNNVRALLRARADVNLAQGNGQQPIHYAAQFKSSECITLLLNAGANVNAQCNFIESPIIAAVRGNKHANISLLITQGGDVNLCKNNGDSALHIAVKEKFEKCVEELLKLGCDKNIKNKEGKTALNIATENKQDKVVALFKDIPERPAQNKEDKTITVIKNTHVLPALHQAFLANKPAEAQKLLESGHSPNEQDHLRRSALFVVCAESKVAFVKLLLKYKADPDLFDDDMNCPLHLACSEGSQAIVKALLDVVDVNLPNKDGMTGLMLASARGHLQVIKVLCQHPGLDLQCMDDEGNNALHHAAKGGFLEVCEFLKNLPGAPDMDSRNNANDSPLVVAAKAGQGKVVKALLIDRVKMNPNLEQSMTSVNLDSAKNFFPDDICEKSFKYGKEENMVDLVLQLKDNLNL